MLLCKAWERVTPRDIETIVMLGEASGGACRLKYECHTLGFFEGLLQGIFVFPLLYSNEKIFLASISSKNGNTKIIGCIPSMYPR
jgi:hypothetical protein